MGRCPQRLEPCLIDRSATDEIGLDEGDHARDQHEESYSSEAQTASGRASRRLRS